MLVTARCFRSVVIAAAVAGTLLAIGPRARAHKPITSPYTYNEDVFPVVRDRCGRCHVGGGVAPMSLLTHAETVPWGESIRTELLAGHMPPFGVEGPIGRFRNVQGLTARELNVLLTWASGGTPVGNDENAPAPVTLERRWQLGEPDLTLPLPSSFTLPAGKQEETVDFTVALPTSEPRWLRAVDLAPGTPAMVRSARINVKSAAPSSNGGGEESLLALWLPGDDPVALDESTAYRLPAGAELTVRVHYRKTWEYEQKAMTDRSSIGLYFAAAPDHAVEALALTPSDGAASDQLSFSRTIDNDVRALAIYPDPDLANADVSMKAVRPDGSRVELITFRPRRGWTRRFWFNQPIGLPRGTRIDVVVTGNAALLPPGAVPPPPTPLDPSKVRVTLNVIAR